LAILREARKEGGKWRRNQQRWKEGRRLGYKDKRQLQE
jgi:hypothetical protein